MSLYIQILLAEADGAQASTAPAALSQLRPPHVLGATIPPPIAPSLGYGLAISPPLPLSQFASETTQNSLSCALLSPQLPPQLSPELSPESSPALSPEPSIRLTAAMATREPEALKDADPYMVDMEDMFANPKKEWRNPLVLCGAVATGGVLVAGLASFRQGNFQKSQMLMRARVGFQAATVALMAGTVYYQGKS